MRNLLRYSRLPVVLLGYLMAHTTLSIELAKSQYDLKYMGLLLILLAYAATLRLSITSKTKETKEIEHEAKNWMLHSHWILLLILGLISKFAAAHWSLPTLFNQFLIVLWLLLTATALFLALGLEWKANKNYAELKLDSAKTATRMQSFLNASFLFCSLVAINYSSIQWNRHFDFSYLQTSKISAATNSIVGKLDHPLTIRFFYQNNNEVKSLALEYFDALAQSSPTIKINSYDKDLHPDIALEFDVVKNGVIAISYKGRTQHLSLGNTTSHARKKLLSLDGLVQHALLTLSRPKKTIYLSSGHGELTWMGLQEDATRSISHLKQSLKQLHYDSKIFSIAEGSLSGVPKDCSLLMIIGPERPFLDQEVQAIKAYLENSGQLMVFFKREVSSKNHQPRPLEALLQDQGMIYRRSLVIDETFHVAATRTKADRMLLYTNNFAHHPSSKHLVENKDHLQVLVFKSGYFDVRPNNNWSYKSILKSRNSSFVATAGSYSFQAGNIRQAHPFVVLAQKHASESRRTKASRIVAFSEASMTSDALLKNQGNATLVLDLVKWLLDDHDILGLARSEADIKISHSKLKDLKLFYLSLFLVPLLVLVFGIIIANFTSRSGARS